MIDLHAHTTASDGSLSPTELVTLARDTGLAAVAITDHDTVGGCAEGVVAGAELGVEVVPGIEVSVDYRKGAEFHLLGYFVDYADAAFCDRLHYLQDNRVNRNLRMIENLAAAGLPISYDDVVAESGGGQVGRPHMAQALVKKGIVATVQEAFNVYLNDNSPYNIPKVKLAPAEAISMLHDAGAVTILAHPKYLGLPDENDLAAELERLKEAGLDGIEVFYSQHTPEETETYLRLARRFDFLMGAGSDFHGASKPHVPLGVIHGGQAGDDLILAAIRAAAGAH